MGSRGQDRPHYILPTHELQLEICTGMLFPIPDVYRVGVVAWQTSYRIGARPVFRL
jgi:hypothetical protein